MGLPPVSSRASPAKFRISTSKLNTTRDPPQLRSRRGFVHRGIVTADVSERGEHRDHRYSLPPEAMRRSTKGRRELPAGCLAGAR